MPRLEIFTLYPLTPTSVILKTVLFFESIEGDRVR